MIDNVGVEIRYSFEPSNIMRDRELRSYINRAKNKFPEKKISRIIIRVDGDEVEIQYRFKPRYSVPAERIKRLEG